MRAGEVHLPEPTTLTIRGGSSDAEEIVENLVRLTKDEKIEWGYRSSGQASVTVGLASFTYNRLASTIWIWVIEGGDHIGLTSKGRATLDELLNPLIERGLEKDRDEWTERSEKARGAALHMLKEAMNSDE